MPAKKCPCGTWNDISASFCRNCGSNLRQNPQTQEHQKSSSKAGAIIIIILYYIVLIAIITGVVIAFL